MRHIPTNLFFLFLCIEVLSATALLALHKLPAESAWQGNYFSLASILYLFSGIFLCFIAVKKWKPVKIAAVSNIGTLLISGIAFFGLIALLKENAAEAFIKEPIDKKFADMLPVIQALSRRFVENDLPIYGPIQELWGGLQPRYLPALWFPFVPYHIFHYDMRWTTIVFLTIGLMLFFLKQRKHSFYEIILYFLLFVCIWYCSKEDPRLVARTQEGVIIGYYLLLAYSLTTRNFWFQGIAIALCLMSRYSLAMWLPFYLLYVFLVIDKKEAVKAAVALGSTVLFLLFISGAYKELHVFLEMQSNYLGKLSNEEARPGYEWTIHNSLGIAKFIKYESLKYLHYSLLALSILVPLTYFSAAWKFSEKLEKEMIAIVSLKLSMIFFFNLMPIPYLYLFYTSTFLSFAVAYAFLDKRLA